MKCITIIISVYRQAHHYLNPIYVDKIFHNNINQQLSLSRINSTTSLYSFISPPLFLILTYFSYFVAFFSCVLHISSLYFDFVISPPIILIAGRWNSSGIHRIEVYTFIFIFWMSWNWVRRLEKFDVEMVVYVKIFQKEMLATYFLTHSSIHKVYFGYIIHDVEERFATYAWLYMIYIFSPSFSKNIFLFLKRSEKWKEEER